MGGDEFIIKKIELSDYDEYYAIRSERKNLFWTGYKKAPDYGKFKSWFEIRVNDPNREIYLMRINGLCVGSFNIDYYNMHAAIGYCVKEAFEGKGHATALINEAIKIIEIAKKIRIKIRTIEAWIYHNNIASIKAVTKNGFRQSEIFEHRERFGQSELYYKYILNI